MRKVTPKVYQCPLCDDDSGAIGTTDELEEHFKEDHLEQEGEEDFIHEVVETFILTYHYISGLRTAMGLDKK
jgi:hypothetical protein